MTVTPADEAPRPPEGEGFSDAVTVAFGDADRELFGLARVGLAGEAASGLGVLFAGGRPVAVRAEGGQAVHGDGWGAAAAAGVRTEVVEPLARWSAAFDGGADGGFELELEALCPPAELPADHPAARAAGMTGYEQLCRVRGTVRAGGREHAVACLGQRGHSWGRADWRAIALARTVSAWLDEGTAVSLAAIRPAEVRHHADEHVAAHLVTAGRPQPVLDARLSTTADADGRQRHAGLELWLGEEEDWPHRAAGEVLCGTTLELGRLRWDCAFFRWWMEGREGVGRYDVVRPAG